LHKTRFGLKIQAAGENPSAADASGISINRVRYGAVLVAGGMAGLGGGILSLSQLRFFTENMTVGRGFVALATVIFGNWRPGYVVLGAVLFGVVDALQLRLQAIGVSVPPGMMTMLPYVVTLAILAAASRRSRMPAFLSRVYIRDAA
ncbi:MAG: ABC transporter permease, partial [Acidimicrobiia bacterium]